MSRLETPTLKTQAQRDAYTSAVDLHKRGLFYCPVSVGGYSAANALVRAGLFRAKDGVRHEETGAEVRGYAVVGCVYPSEVLANAGMAPTLEPA